MQDVGKRNLVISRLNPDLDCIDVRDPKAMTHIPNQEKLVQLYKTLIKSQEEYQLDEKMLAKSFEQVGTDPAKIIELHLMHSILGSDMILRKTSFPKGQIMVHFYGRGLD